MKFQELALPPEFLAFLDEKGYKDLYPPQEAAVKAGLLEGKSLVISIADGFRVRRSRR